MDAGQMEVEVLSVPHHLSSWCQFGSLTWQAGLVPPMTAKNHTKRLEPNGYRWKCRVLCAASDLVNINSYTSGRIEREGGRMDERVEGRTPSHSIHCTKLGSMSWLLGL